MDDGSQSDSLFTKLGARRFGVRELLADAIAEIPERERLVFTLYYYEELETSKIALVFSASDAAITLLTPSRALIHCGAIWPVGLILNVTAIRW